MNNEQVRKRLVKVLNDHGIKLKFVAEKCQINYNNLTSFKSGKLDYSTDYLLKLDKFLKKYERNEE